MTDGPNSEERDLLEEARKKFALAEEAESENRANGRESIRFGRLGKQWPDHVEAQREHEQRPTLTLNKMPAFIRQVVNDARQNKPSITVSPVDSQADIETANVIAGIVRHIERSSNADIAYDTAIENAVTCFAGYVRVDIAESNNSFDDDIAIRRILDPMTVYGDPMSESVDGSDWNDCFVAKELPKAEYERKYKGKSKVDWTDSGWSNCAGWKQDNAIRVAEWWTREKVEKIIYEVAVQGRTEPIVVDQKYLANPEYAALLEIGAIQVLRERAVDAYSVKQRVINGMEVLSELDWAGQFIPIIPVYGDEFFVDGKRHIRSLIWDAMDAQRIYNYWRSAAVELVGLAPRVPFIGPKGAFESDRNRWETANTVSHSYIEYDGPVAPQRQPLDSGPAAGALQEALNASDDMKAILGIYDASLGARSNETSGRAIMARKAEGDTATYHFIDNLSRSIRQVGRVVIDLIPHVYSGRSAARILGEDGKEESIPLGAPRMIEKPGQEPYPVIHDLSKGQYDLAVTVGPSFATKRMENAYNMIEFVRAVPQVGPMMIDKIASSQDWEGAQEIAERAKAMLPGNGQEQQLPPEIMQALQEGRKAQQELEAVKADQSLEAAKLQIEKFRAETERMKVSAELAKASAMPSYPYQLQERTG